MTAALSDDVRAAIDAALDDLPQPESRFERDRWRTVSGIAVDAVAPLIRAAERERIRQIAIRTGAVCPGDEGTNCYFADLIGGEP